MSSRMSHSTRLPDPLADFDLTGKVALITGASRGIGATIAATYAAAGAQVALCSRKQEGVDAVAQAIAEQGGQTLALAVHTGDLQAIQQLVEQVEATWGGIDILVNNAATSPHFGPLLTAEESHWAKTLDVNVQGYFRCIQTVAPIMKRRGGGKIINMASIGGLRPLPDMGLYSVSKAAVLMLTQTLAVELAPDNIQVNAIAPGFVKTRFSQAIWSDPAYNDPIVAAIPQQRMAEAHELTGMALYLASAASAYTTGAIMVVDGGHTIAAW
jgi:NAD(P)-dependent dehydrogenase (short-subunit alcohol dehydrogenase family)